MTLKNKPFETVDRKGENADNPAFPPFPSMYFFLLVREYFFSQWHLFCRLQILSIWTNIKLYRFVRRKKLM